MSVDIEAKKEDTVRLLEPTAEVGFNNMPTQFVNKSIKKGFVFNIMCIGETGLGKSTLMESLFNTTFDSVSKTHQHSKVQLVSQTYDLEEDNVHLKLTICNTVGYGDQINKTDSLQAILDYIDGQYEIYLEEELKLENRNMSKLHDSRIHVCLYFISPTGHGLKPLDVFSLKKLDKKVNIIPLIAKADTLTKNDLEKFKNRIMSELMTADIHFYQSQSDEENEMEGFNLNFTKYMPFAVVGSEDFVLVNDKLVRGREYPWGVVEIENKQHCDFVQLRELLIRNNMEDLREKTHCKFYELYRQERLIALGFDESCDNGVLSSLKHMVQTKQLNLSAEFQAKEEQIRQHFLLLIKAKDNEFNERERELCNHIQKLKEEHSAAVRELEKAYNLFNDECNEFNNYKAQFYGTQQSIVSSRPSNMIQAPRSASTSHRKLKK